MNEPTIPSLPSNNVPWSGAAALITPEPWVQDAACAQTDPELFFPEKGYSPEPARKICLGCDVLEQCFEYALRTNQTSGVWGGHSERQLARIRRAAGAAA